MAEAGSGAWHGARDVAAARASDVARAAAARKGGRPGGPKHYYRLALTCPLNGQDAKWIRSLRGLDRNVDRIVS